MNLLKQEAEALTPPGKVALGTWPLLHTCLTQTLEATVLLNVESY